MSYLRVYYTIEEIFKTEIKSKSKEFKEGFKSCLDLLKIGCEKRTDYNKLIRIHELEIENHKLKKIISVKHNKLADLERDLGSTSLITGIATELYREFLVDTPVGNFTIVVNMDTDTMNLCLINFNQKHSFKAIDEGKSKLLGYINNKASHGFKGYKSKYEAIKEGVKML